MDEAVVIGAGAIGLLLADALAEAGLPVTVLGGTAFQRIRLTGDVDRDRPVRHLAAWDGRARSGPAVVAVKAHQTASAGPLIAAAARSASAVVVAQNGVEHRERVAPFVGSAPVVPLLLYVPVERTAPGEAVVHLPADRDVVAPSDGPAQAVAALLEAGGLRVGLEQDFRTAAWRKLLMNTASMGTTTLTGRPMSVLREPAVAAFAEGLVAEGAEAARAEGARIGTEEPAEIVRWLQALPDGATTSMLQDREAGRPLEWDAIHGAALRAADRAGLPAPLLRSVTALLAAASD